ncbi:hypothetical protein VTK56DRAFT_1641 [Thermocarpiscus australiensis]
MPSRPSLLSIRSALWLLLASSTHHAAAHPLRRDELQAAGYGYLLPRQQTCAGTLCGADNQFCCESGSVCTTANGIALCTAAAGGGYAFYTTTCTVTKTFTKTYSSWIPATTAATGKCIPPEGSGWIACGQICCASWQYCAYEGQCMGNPGTSGAGGGVVVSTSVVTGVETITTQYSAPFRVTSGTATATATAASTSTGTAAGVTETTGAVTPSGTGSQLSGGAIAGIVVGTLAGVALLLLLCACCIARGLWHGFLAIFGLGKKKKSETFVEEERYTRRGSSHVRREHHGSWYGGRPTSAAARKEKSKGMGLLGLGAALGTLALLLGLKRDKKKAATVKSRSDISSSYYDSYSASSPSSFSSGRRTRRSARHSRTGSSRVTRTTHTHNRVSRAPSARSHRSPR